MCSSLCLLEPAQMLKYQHLDTSSFETKAPQCKISVMLKSEDLQHQASAAAQIL